MKKITSITHAAEHVLETLIEEILKTADIKDKKLHAVREALTFLISHLKGLVNKYKACFDEIDW